ncbi:zinc finger BED domain-containing protein RICESLEEPER 2 isoform X2 [Helianthus annuus]|nr:zinc finger BED domain-containing protein RICESLEEPER 2 isoform X2 [Helianthus annuus]
MSDSQKKVGKKKDKKSYPESDSVKIDLENDSSMNMDVEDDEVHSVEVDDTNDSDDNKSGVKRQRKERSIVWQYFTKLKKKAVGGKVPSKCNKCNHIIIYDSKQGTGNISKHIKSCYGSSFKDVGQMILNSDMKLKSSTFSQSMFREMLVAAIVMHELPLSFVDYKGFRDLFKYLQPDVNIISRNTVKSDLLKMYKREKEKVKEMLMESPGRLCLTSDLWTSIATDGYLAITVHFMDKQWVLQKRVLSFSFMPPPHTGVALCEKVFSILVEWGIENKIFSMTLDNASSNDTFIGLLREQLNKKLPLVSRGNFFHLRCCAHILNLIVQDGLKQIDECIYKVRESIKYVKGSQQRKEKFIECVQLLSLKRKKGLRQDVVTRWNSTFLMLDGALFYRRAFCHLELSDSNYKHCPNALEWEKIGKMCSFLGVFYDITNVFSGSKYPTANLYYPHVFMAYLTLKEGMGSEDEYMRKMADLMMTKFQKYWSDFSLTLAIAVVLDPRYKLHFIEWSYSQVYGRDSKEYEYVDEVLHSTFHEYVELNMDGGSSTTSNVASTSEASKGVEDTVDDDSTSVFGVRARLKDFDQFQSKDFLANKKSELQLYLDESRVDRNSNLDVLTFWKANEFRYPTLARMARDFLTIPVSTVASESTFSASGRVLNEHRSSLGKDTVEALICTKDWLYGDYCSNEVNLDELTEDIMSLDISGESNASNSMNNSKV